MSAELPPEAHIGSVALAVPDPERIASFYHDTVGLEQVGESGRFSDMGVAGRPLVRLSSAVGKGRDSMETAGLFHLAIRVPTRAALADALKRIDYTHELSGASDHGFSEALYLRDPAGNGVEIYCDRNAEDWPWTQDGSLRAITRPLDLDAFRDVAIGDSTVPDRSDVGHVHLAVSDVDRSLAFYRGSLGFDLTMRPTADAAFLSAGDYHHHIGINTWEGRTEPSAEPGLSWFDVVLPDEASRDAVLERVRESGGSIERPAGTPTVRDPDGIGIRLISDD